MKAYVEGVVAGREKWDGERLVGIIDGFGGVLTRHLSDEIGTLQRLRRFGERFKGLMKEVEKEAEDGMVSPCFIFVPARVGVVWSVLTASEQKKLGGYGLAWAFLQIDQELEEGLWKDWPAAPFPVKFITKSVVPRFYGDALKYSACDKSGRLQPLYMLRETNKG